MSVTNQRTVYSALGDFIYTFPLVKTSEWVQILKIWMKRTENELLKLSKFASSV